MVFVVQRTTRIELIMQDLWNMDTEVSALEHAGLKVYFDPFQFSMEENNRFLAEEYEVIPISV
jgi:hypothetical protein